jgi:tRNA (guanine-N7-)-methyltransferase
MEPVRRLRSYGRIGGRPLSNRQKLLVEEVLHDRSILKIDNTKRAEIFVCDDEFLNSFPEFWLEIGFGGAEHLIEQAKRRADVGFIGAEPFLEGVAKALSGCVECGLQNVRVHMGDVRDMIPHLPLGSVSRIFIMFPDPWPKRRHWKRRLIQPDFVAELARLLKPGGEVRFATDVMSYADEALFHFVQRSDFAWISREAADWRVAPADHVRTRYESKRLGDCEPVFLHFRRL